MREKGIKVPVEMIAKMMEICIDRGEMLEARNIMIESKKEDNQNPPYSTLGMLVDACAKDGDFGQVRQIFDELKNIDILPDSSMFALIAKSIVLISTNNNASPKKVLASLEDGPEVEMLSRSNLAAMMSMNELIDIYRKLDCLDPEESEIVQNIEESLAPGDPLQSVNNGNIHRISRFVNNLYELRNKLGRKNRLL